MQKIGRFNGPEWVKNYCVERERLSDCIERWKFTFKDEYGYIYICMPYPGIHLWANDIYMSSIPTERLEKYHFLKLNYCGEGRAEVLLADERYVYLEEGLLSIDTNEPKEDFLFPGGRYAGLELVVNMEELAKHPIQAFTDCGIELAKTEELLRRFRGSYVGAVSGEWKLLAESVMKKLMKTEGGIEDFRFYTLQLLYLIQKGSITSPEHRIYLTRGQRRIVAEVERRLTRDLKRRYTIDSLADEYGISPSSLKKYFEQVYGMTISEYMKGKRIEQACRMLSETRMSIADIAAEAGYSNQGKFGSVFKKCTQRTPLEYRRLHRERRERE